VIDRLPHYLFFVVMTLDVLGWSALVLFPRRPWANFWFSGLVIPLMLYCFYMYLLVTFWFRPPAAVFSQFFTLEGVYAMFGNSGLLLVGWLNLITTDLVAGAWMARKAAQIRMPYVYLLPCLVVTAIFAGFGFTLFAIFVAIGRGWSEIAKFEDAPPTNTDPVAVRPSAA
jgi:hypothetical protein